MTRGQLFKVIGSCFGGIMKFIVNYDFFFGGGEDAEFDFHGLMVSADTVFSFLFNIRVLKMFEEYFSDATFFCNTKIFVFVQLYNSMAKSKYFIDHSDES